MNDIDNVETSLEPLPILTKRSIGYSFTIHNYGKTKNNNYIRDIFSKKNDLI